MNASFLLVGRSSAASVIWLADSGLSGTVCPDGDLALDMLGQRRYHAVLCDLKLPSMNGVELMECIRQEFPEVAFVMVTERSDIRHGILAMISGADGYIHPPLAPCAIVASLDRALKRKRIESALAKRGRRSGLCGTSLERTP